MNNQLDIFSNPLWRPQGFHAARPSWPEAQVFSILISHAGRDRAIKAGTLAGLSGIETDDKKRSVRKIIKSLTEIHGLAIASALDNPAGYFLVETNEELAAYCRQLKHRSLSGLVRCAKLERRKPEYLGQIGMELG